MYDVMAASNTRRLVVRVDGVSHEIARAETDPDGNTAHVILLCSMKRASFVDPRMIVNVPDGAGIDCMTCLVRRART